MGAASPRQMRPRSPVEQVIRAIDRTLEYIEVTIVAGSIILMALIMVTHVLGRMMFRIGVPGRTEVTELLIVLITFVGVSYAVRRARHISMSAIYDTLRGPARKTMIVLISVGTGALLFYMAWEAAGYVETTYNRGRSTSALNIPLWMIYISMPIGFTLAGIQYWLTAFRNLTSPEFYRSFTELEGYDEVPDAAQQSEEQPKQ
ncbi:TRAP transporter small permease [Aquisalimonas asiatica]|uniref:TRAP transporter small permease protein n=1 Tax=Aquisalimonas asiatica TaxID=406100 RepID=A0A1H8SQW3_9GAMM|nr:TRAP transporter small permease [Aquisalimonas asiatica]SEO80896.1 TRAP-type C4-dicarboxylate transport system, small permease component [Aquisalimonas asiatica]